MDGAAIAANAAASTLAAQASSAPSTSNCRMRRPRPAPIEIRSAISRSRASARAVNRLARLEQAISSSKPATTARIHNGRANVSRNRDGPFGAGSTCRWPRRKRSTTVRDSSARNPAACSRRKFAYTACNGGRTASGVTPGFSLPNTLNQYVSESDRSAAFDVIMIGTQRSVPLPGSMPVNPFSVTPTI